MDGTASIWSFIVPHPPLLPAYADLAPYNAIVVALDQNPTIRFVGNLLAHPDGAINEMAPLAETTKATDPHMEWLLHKPQAPAVPPVQNRAWLKNAVHLRHLDEMEARIRVLEGALETAIKQRTEQS